MTNVIPIKSDEFKHCSYIDSDGQIGIAMLNNNLTIEPINTKEFVVTMLDDPLMFITFNREELAEFIHVAKILIDSQDKWLPDFEMVGINYD